jgi:hypothetical protein
MNSKPCPVDYDGPSRETAATRLKHLVEQQERKLKGLQMLLSLAEKLESGSPLEELLWELSCSRVIRGLD